jgi:hypothetical protein
MTRYEIGLGASFDSSHPMFVGEYVVREDKVLEFVRTHRKKVTPTQLLENIGVKPCGHTYKKLIEILNRHQYLSRIKFRNNAGGEQRYGRYNTEIKEFIAQMYSEGVPVQNLAEVFQRSTKAIYHIANMAGVHRPN